MKVDIVKIEKITFLISFGIAYIALVSKSPLIIFVILIFALLYLFSGWYFLSIEVKDGQKTLPFIVSYLIAQTYMAIVFAIRDYPLKKEFALITSACILLVIITLFVNEKKLIDKYPLKSYINRLWLCLIFAGSYAWI